MQRSVTRGLLGLLIVFFSSFSLGQVSAPPRDGAYQAPAPQLTVGSIVGTYTGTYGSTYAESSGTPITSRIVVDKTADPGKVDVEYRTVGSQYAQGPCPGTGRLKGMDLQIRIPSSAGCEGRVMNLKVGATALTGTMEVQGAGLIKIKLDKSALGAKP